MRRRLTLRAVALLTVMAAGFVAAPAPAAAAPSTASLQRQVAQLSRTNALLRAQLAGARRMVAARDVRIKALVVERDAARAERDAARAALLADLKAKVSLLTNSELYLMALDMVVALEDDCTYSGDITTVPGAGGSATFTRLSGGC